MTIPELIFGTGYSLFAFFAAIGIVLFFAALLHVEQHFGHWAQPALIPIIALGICASSLLSGRSLQNAATDLSLGVDGDAGSGSLALRLLTLAILGICLARISGQWLRRQETKAAAGASLFWAFTAYFLAHSVLSSAFGTQPVFIHNIFYGVVVFAAVFAARHEPLSTTLSMAKIALFGMMFMSLLLAIIKPNLALEPGYKGWIPGLSVRLWGVSSNANSIGPLALVALLLEYMQPYQKRWLHWLVWLMTWAVFVLAQSKTVWGVFIVLLPMLMWHRMARPKQGVDIRLVLILIGLASSVFLLMLVFDPISLWEKFVDTKQGSQLTTLTGRSQIWAVAISEWLNNPLFGYGPEIWGPAFRAHIGMQFAFSAHNQFLQSLSSAGAVGLLSLIIYLGLLGRYAHRCAAATKGVAVAIYVLTLIRCMTETPLVLGTMFNGEFLIHILLFQIVVHDRSMSEQETVPSPSSAHSASLRTSAMRNGC